MALSHNDRTINNIDMALLLLLFMYQYISIYLQECGGDAECKR